MLLIESGFKCFDGLPVQNKQKQQDNGSKQTNGSSINNAKITGPNLYMKGSRLKGDNSLLCTTVTDDYRLSTFPLSGRTETSTELLPFVFPVFVFSPRKLLRLSPSLCATVLEY